MHAVIPTPDRRHSSAAEMSSPAERDALVQAIEARSIAHADATPGAHPERTTRGAGRYGVLAVVSLAVLVAFAFGGAPARAPEPIDVSQGTRFAMWLLAREIDGFQRVHGRLPSSLGEIQRTDATIAYRIVDSGVYELRVAVPSLVWRSTASLGTIADGAPRTMQSGAAGRPAPSSARKVRQ